MRRGEIRLVDLDPVRGSESSKRRPAVIVSNDSANATAARLRRGVVTVGTCRRQGAKDPSARRRAGPAELSQLPSELKV